MSLFKCNVYDSRKGFVGCISQVVVSSRQLDISPSHHPLTSQVQKFFIILDILLILSYNGKAIVITPVIKLLHIILGFVGSLPLLCPIRTYIDF
jgi:hypothetical protein